MDPIIHHKIVRGRKVRIDCIAWNRTVLLSFSITKKRIPVNHPRTYVAAEATFSSRPNVAFTIASLPDISISVVKSQV
jgi:hypothetical protein